MNTFDNFGFQKYAKPVGYRKDGRPIYLIAGGEDDPSNPVPPPADPPNPDLKFTVEDIEKARKEEKDKVYKALEAERTKREAFEQQLAELADATKAREKAEAEALQKAEADAKAKQEAEMSARDLAEQRAREAQQALETAQANWEKQFQDLQAERAQERALLDKERELAQLQSYTQTRISQEQSNLAPELIEFISGSTPEEVDASIERVKAKSVEIMEAARAAFQQQRNQMPGVSPTGYGTSGPMELGDTTKQYSAEDIKNMTVQEYREKIRPNIPGLAGSTSNRGMYS